MIYLLTILLLLVGCGNNNPSECLAIEASVHSDLSNTFATARRCEITPDIATLEERCGCDRNKPYGGMKTVQTISCGSVTSVEEVYPYYGLRFRYREGRLEFVGGKQAGPLAACYSNTWDSTYNGCQTKTFVYCL